MKLKIFKKKIETVLFKRLCEEKKYIIFFSAIKANLVSINSYNVLNYSLKSSFQNFMSLSLINNFLKASSFLNIQDFNFFLKNLKLNINLIYLLKLNNLYFLNMDSDFEKKFNSININIYTFLTHLQKLFLYWIPLLKLVIKESINIK
jgi:hypothetical protein